MYSKFCTRACRRQAFAVIQGLLGGKKYFSLQPAMGLVVWVGWGGEGPPDVHRGTKLDLITGMQLHFQYLVTKRLERDFSQGHVVMGQGGMDLS